MRKKLSFLKKANRLNDNGSYSDERNIEWEEFYKRRWSYDKSVRTTHGVNCTGSCSWKVFVKDGIITWENQATDYPSCGVDMPEFEPRGCPRGASFSWYEYSPLRIKYPYIRGRLWTMWQNALKEFGDPVKAWASIVEDPEKSKTYKALRGKAGMVRVTFDDAYKMISAMLVYTIKKYGPDRIVGFSPIPAMSMISYAAGSRFISLLGGELLSFYDWYADLPPASPQIWGEQTDVPESSDWYNAGYIITWGSNVPMTRTPDAHFLTEVRYKGTKVVAVAPDYAESVKFADNWICPNPGTDGALAQGMTHVILRDFYVKRKEPLFVNYAKQYTDLPFLIKLEKTSDGKYKAGKFLRIEEFTSNEVVNGDWKPVIFDVNSQQIVAPNGTIGQRWSAKEKWNLKLENENGEKIVPTLSLLHEVDAKKVAVKFPTFDEGSSTFESNCAVKEVKLANGKTELIATVYDLMLAQYGLDDDGNVNNEYNTPEWQEAFTGVKANIVEKIATEFAENAVVTGGRSMIIMGAGINHWYNGDTIYRAILNLVILTASEGVQGGGWAHYVGQEKCRPYEGWGTVAFAKDWQVPPRQQNGTSFFYFATDQWRYEEKALSNELYQSKLVDKIRYSHPADYNILAARLGWLPSYPQFNKSSIEIAKPGMTNPEVIANLVKELKSGETYFAVENPDAPENFPRGLFVWRSNLMSSSNKGQEYFMKHLLGTTDNLSAKASTKFKPEEMKWHDEEVTGKLDLLVSLDFRMTATPLYSDIVLPTATWYEKEDLSSTDMHPFVHPFNKAIDPLWESRSDWDIFKGLAHNFTELAKTQFTAPVIDVVAVPLNHDSAAEISQAYGSVKDWKKGEIEAIPGKTMPNFAFVERDYSLVYDKYISLGPLVETMPTGAHGISFKTAQQYGELKQILGTYADNTIKNGRPKIDVAKKMADCILTLSGATNGELAMRAWEFLEEKSGVPLKDIAAKRQGEKMTFESLTVQPKEVIPTPIFTGSNVDGKRYSPFTTSIERLIPFRTLTGRQHFYIDHDVFFEYGENFPVFKPTLPKIVFGNQDEMNVDDDALVLRFLTPHGKWNLHSMYQDSLTMLTLFRGYPTAWLSDIDAEKHGIKDGDWLEIINRNGCTMSKAVVSSRMPQGSMFMYHAQDRHINMPGTKTTKNRGGSHNSPTKVHIKPTQVVGGYAQLSYGFNYYGPIGNQRDSYVSVRKIEEVDWLED